MRTRLGEFSKELHGLLLPVRQALGPFTREAGGAPATPELADELREAGGELEELAGDLERRRAHVVVFGAPKSGKSVLLNAIAAEYVTRVDAFPSYPCLVRISHSRRWRALVTRHDGRREAFSDPAATRIHIQRSQAELAARTREGEAPGPESTRAEGLRRIDVALPARGIEASGLSLVEAPARAPGPSGTEGGVELALSDLEGESASAVLVCRCDDPRPDETTLRLTALVRSFERVHVVLNIDPRALNLAPDGGVVPAFEALDSSRLAGELEARTFSAELRRAAEEGRLRITVLDLLAEASGRLRQGRDEGKGAGPEEEEGEAEAPSETFEILLRDLLLDLDSDPTVEIVVGDCLRRARQSIQRLVDALDSPLASALGEARKKRERERAERAARISSLEHLERLCARDWEWENAFSATRERAEEKLRGTARATAEAFADGVDSALQEWFASDRSLVELNRDLLLPVLSAGRQRIELALPAILGEEVSSGRIAASLPSSLADELERAGVDLAARATEALGRMDPLSGEESDEPLVLPSEIPVRRGPLDLLRGGDAARERIFGRSANPDVPLSKADKANRLHVDALASMRRVAKSRLVELLLLTARHVARRGASELASRVAHGLAAEIARRKGEDEAPHARLQAELHRILELESSLATLGSALGDALPSLHELTRRLGWPSDAESPAPQTPGATEPLPHRHG